MKTVLVERYATLGGVCLNVGCIPSKRAAHRGRDGRVKALAKHGISYGEPTVEIGKLRELGRRDQKLTGGLVGMAKARKGRHRARRWQSSSTRITSKWR